jgi:N-acetylneuraminate synthase
MITLQENFPDAVIGLSDHTTSNLACLGAVALGASILERHFTDTMQRTGPDISCSMDEENCKNLIHESKIMQIMRGGEKGPVNEEKPTIDFAFASVVTIKTIKKGEYFSNENIWVKRPGTGEILAKDYEKVLGKKARKEIGNDEMLTWNDIEN